MQSATATPSTVLWISLWITSLPEVPALPWLRRVAERVGGQVQPRPPAVYELVEVAGEALLEVVVLGAGTDGPFDAGQAVHAERHRPHLPPIPLRAVVPALHRPHLARAGVAGDGPAIRPLPFG